MVGKNPFIPACRYFVLNFRCQSLKFFLMGLEVKTQWVRVVHKREVLLNMQTFIYHFLVVTFTTIDP
jgi:hypothetical protein